MADVTVAIRFEDKTVREKLCDPKSDSYILDSSIVIVEEVF